MGDRRGAFTAAAALRRLIANSKVIADRRRARFDSRRLPLELPTFLWSSPAREVQSVIRPLEPHFNLGVPAAGEHIYGDIGVASAEQKVDLGVGNGEVCDLQFIERGRQSRVVENHGAASGIDLHTKTSLQ
jgi:hypothetical protein